MRDNSSVALRVLVVDDWPDTGESMAALLRLWGHDVRTAHDGVDALAAAAVYHPNVVLLDVSMPGMDGYQVAQRLRQHPDLRRTFIVSVTGHAEEEAARRAHEAGCDRHLLKPVDPDTLHELLDARKEAQQEPERSPEAMVSDRAEKVLRGNPYLALKNVSCAYRDGVLTLQGCLPTYYLKQIAQSAVLGIPGVEQIRNEIAVGAGAAWPR